MKNTTIVSIIIGIIIVGFGAYFLLKSSSPVAPVTPPQETATNTVQTESKPVATPVDKTKTVLGTSVQKRDITAYHYGTGNKELLFVGGIHGGYEWNTALVAYQLMDYLATNP